MNTELENRSWSFSSVNCYENCPKNFYLTYIKNAKKSQNAFAEWGNYIHGLLEKYYKGECEFFELSQLYDDGYSDNVKENFPPNKYVILSESYKEKGYEYLSNFEGLPDNYEVMCVEERVELTINSYKFIGYIDLVIRDKNDGKIIVYDHKSKSGFKNKTELSEYLRQLYLYSVFIKEKYGEYPKELVFNMFRAGKIVTTKFDEAELNKAVNWFTTTIGKIQNDNKFIDKIGIEYKKKGKKLSEYKNDDFFCCYLCGSRSECNRSAKQKKKAGA